MTHVTSIGLDVHAGSVSACAFGPFTGEAAQGTFGTDAAEIAGWILGFENRRGDVEVALLADRLIYPDTSEAAVVPVVSRKLV